MSVAVIDIAGKQFTVRVGTSFWVDRMTHAVGDVVALRRVVLFMGDEECRIGDPFDKDMVVYLRVQEHARAKKVLIFKKKRRHGYRRFKGFRADQTCVEIVALETKINKNLEEACPVGELSSPLEASLVPVVSESARDKKKPVRPKAEKAAPKEKKVEEKPKTQSVAKTSSAEQTKSAGAKKAKAATKKEK